MTARIGRPPRPLAERFWSHVAVKGETECWYWTGALQNGTPRFVMTEHGRQVTRMPRRIAWQLTTGKVAPRGVQIDMTCGNGFCVNPAHMKEHELLTSRWAVLKRKQRQRARERRRYLGEARAEAAE